MTILIIVSLVYGGVIATVVATIDNISPIKAVSLGFIAAVGVMLIMLVLEPLQKYLSSKKSQTKNNST